MGGNDVPIAKKTAIEWVNGVPEAVYKNITPTSVKQLANTALSLPYQGEYIAELDTNVIEPRFAGMSNAEVMWVKMAEKAANGDLKAAEMILDRVLGKPKQSVESATMTMNYTEFLDYLSKKQD